MSHGRAREKIPSSNLLMCTLETRSRKYSFGTKWHLLRYDSKQRAFLFDISNYSARKNRWLTVPSPYPMPGFLCNSITSRSMDRPTNDLISTRHIGRESNSKEDHLLRSPGDLDLNRPPPLRSIHITLCTPLGWTVGIEGSVITVSELTILGLYAVWEHETISRKTIRDIHTVNSLAVVTWGPQARASRSKAQGPLLDFRVNISSARYNLLHVSKQ